MGRVTEIGLAGNGASVTFAKPAARAAAFQAMLYVLGLTVVAVYGIDAEAEFGGTAGIVLSVIEGGTL